MAKDYDALIVGGFGHIGLPLGIALAHSGAQVALYDLDQAKRKGIEAGIMPFTEEGAEPILRQVIGRTLHVVDSLESIARARSVIITIGTPLDGHGNPSLGDILDLAEAMVPYLSSDAHLVLRSTVYPGTTRRLGQVFAEAQAPVHLAFCPERIVQGHALRELRELPQLVSGLTETAVERSQALFHRMGSKTLVTGVEEAELAKLFANAWRYITFATSNQFYMISEQLGVDFEKVRYALTYGYTRTHGFPGPGFAAGPCLLKDTMQLAAAFGNNFHLGHAAMLVNEGLPNFIVDRLRREHDLSRETVGILGMAFKADSDDRRDSLSYKLAKLLRFHGARVLCTDPFIRDPAFVGVDEVLAKSSIVIVAAPHGAYRTLVIPDDIKTIDVWGCLPDLNSKP